MVYHEPMDSISQIALGSAVGLAVMGRRTRPWKAALWGGICGTLPDLDTFIDHGDPIRNVTLHRAESHALFYLTLVSPAIAWLISRIHGEADRFRYWWLAVWLALITHALLDVMTVYGTQLLLPFSDYPFGVGSVFIIDPLFTLPVLVGVIAALSMREARGLRVNAVCLALGVAYLAWGFGAQQYVKRIAHESLRAQGIEAERVEVGPTAFNSILWRVLAIAPGTYAEGFYSLLDERRTIDFVQYPRDEALYERVREDPNVQRVAWFSHGFFKVFEREGRVLISDLRMGMEPVYTFTFVVGRLNDDHFVPVTPYMAPSPLSRGPALAWLWRRLKGEQLPPLYPPARETRGAAGMLPDNG